MKKEWRLSLPVGFRIEEKTEYTTVGQAEGLLLTKRANRYVAAIEVAYSYVMQAFVRRNSSIEENPRLSAAVAEWMRRHHLRWDDGDVYGYDEVEILD